MSYCNKNALYNLRDSPTALLKQRSLVPCCYCVLEFTEFQIEEAATSRGQLIKTRDIIDVTESHTYVVDKIRCSLSGR